MEIRKTVITSIIILFAAPLQSNHPPAVKIESPLNHATLSIDTPTTYQIQVADQEDGDSRYDEINTKEVLLEVARINPGEKIPPAGTSATPTRPSALSIMATHNCFNCHQFNAQGLGPSFFEIAKRYPATTANTDTLIRRIRDGSSGIWGRTEKMPAHPELTAAAIRSTARWILQSAARPDRAYFTGTTGILHFPDNHPGTYALTATYTDHGPKDQPGPHLTGTDKTVVVVK